MGLLDSKVDDLKNIGAISESTASRIREKNAEKVAEKLVDETEIDLEAAEAPPEPQVDTRPVQEQIDEVAVAQESEEPTISQPQEPVAPTELAPLTPDQLQELSKEQAQEDAVVEAPETEVAPEPTGVDRFAKAVRESADVQAEAAEVVSKRQNEALKDIETNVSRREQALEDIITERDEQGQRLQESLNEFKNLKEVDPDRFRKNMGVGQSILAFIGMALGGQGAVDIFNKRIEQDINSQIKARDDAKTVIKGQERGLDRLRAKLKDERDAISAFRIIRFEDLKNELAARASQFQAPQIRANAEKAIAEIELKVQQESNKIKANQLKRIGADAKTLRQEFNKITKDLGTRDIAVKLRTMEDLQKNPSAAGDLSLIFSLMKVLDPRSVVREGEFATASKAGSVPQRIWAQYNKVIEGTRLTESQRADFVNQARNIANSSLTQQKAVNARYKSLAQKSGLDPSLIVDPQLEPSISGKETTESLEEQDLDALRKKRDELKRRVGK